MYHLVYQTGQIYKLGVHLKVILRYLKKNMYITFALISDALVFNSIVDFIIRITQFETPFSKVG